MKSIASVKQTRHEEFRKFGPKSEHFSGQIYPACGFPFKIGDYTTLVQIGPGANTEEQRKCREGRPFNSVAIEVHWRCATGKEAGE